ncbi:MAG: mechanosensitive ion channel family protein [Armatimonadetes bacterium]|nr:mechanosensitive ion channel family protein [Armatimonadota bacterium]
MPDILTSRFWEELWTKAGMAALESGWDVVRVVILFMVGRILLAKIMNSILGSLSRREGREGEGEQEAKLARLLTLGTLIRSIGSYILFFIAGIMLLEAFGLKPMSVLATAGVAGLAVGFGAQRLVRDVITGFFILLENQFSVGDYVTIGTASGVVEEMGMRITKIRDDTGRLVILSNGDIVQVINHSRGLNQVAVEFGVSPDTDIEQLQRLVEEKIGSKLADREQGVLEAPRLTGIVAMDAARMTLRVTARVQPKDRPSAEMALRRELRAGLKEQGINLV